ncbi:MAG: hypothetical protein ACAF41_34550 (plasmid) [Leptolyngbya sp. BL-A-14]
MLITLYRLPSTPPTVRCTPLSFATTRSDLDGNDTLDWASLGPVVPPQPFKVLPPVFTATSADGFAVSVEVPPASNPGITPPLLFQTTATGIPTNFAAGDFVLFTGLLPTQFPAPGNPGPLTLSFKTPVAGVGTQLAVDDVLQFTAFVAAFDSSNQLLGRFAASGTSSLALDNSAVFLGLLSDTANIARVEFSTSVPDRAIGINSLSLATAAVPEPHNLAALLMAGCGLVVAKQWRTRGTKG